MLPGSESFGLNFSSALLSTQSWADRALRTAEDGDSGDQMDFFSWLHFASLPPPPIPIQPVNIPNKSQEGKWYR